MLETLKGRTDALEKKAAERQLLGDAGRTGQRAGHVRSYDEKMRGRASVQFDIAFQAVHRTAG
ncbi:hypothetical protein [Arthrobacter sp. NPDC093139]|uniref:hypothetical protein n=1 Tax=Arthrobacter sp. NPDC093139 TaxID=3363945 RepID=UPI0038187BAF